MCKGKTDQCEAVSGRHLGYTKDRPAFIYLTLPGLEGEMSASKRSGVSLSNSDIISGNGILAGETATNNYLDYANVISCTTDLISSFTA